MDDTKPESTSNDEGQTSGTPAKPLMSEEPVLDEPTADHQGDELQEGESPYLTDDDTGLIDDDDEKIEDREDSFFDNQENDPDEPAVRNEEGGYSPYFPRGVYEDARSVEEYYGRDEPVKTYSAFDRPVTEMPARVKFSYRLVIIIIAVLVVLSLLLLAVSGRVSFPFL